MLKKKIEKKKKPGKVLGGRNCWPNKPENENQSKDKTKRVKLVSEKTRRGGDSKKQRRRRGKSKTRAPGIHKEILGNSGSLREERGGGGQKIKCGCQSRKKGKER